MGLAVLGAVAGCTSDGAQIDSEAAYLPSGEDSDVEIPEVYYAKFESTAGDFVVEVHEDWAPRGAARFYQLVDGGVFNGCRFFRVLDGFMAQTGINGDPEVAAAWKDKTIPDDPVKQSNKRGFVTFATSGPNSRTTQFFINFGNNGQLDGQGFSPFGQVVEGMENVDKLYSGYGEGFPRGQGPRQDLIQSTGNSYLEKNYPKLDYIKKATIVEKPKAADSGT